MVILGFLFLLPSRFRNQPSMYISYYSLTFLSIFKTNPSWNSWIKTILKPKENASLFRKCTHVPSYHLNLFLFFIKETVPSIWQICRQLESNNIKAKRECLIIPQMYTCSFLPSQFILVFYQGNCAFNLTNL